MLITSVHSSSFMRNKRLSLVIPALFIKIVGYHIRHLLYRLNWQQNQHQSHLVAYLHHNAFLLKALVINKPDTDVACQ